MLFVATVLLPLQSRGPHGPTTGDCIGQPLENERGRGLHVGSVSSRTSNTHQRTAPRRYVQKWRSSRSTVRRRRRRSPTSSRTARRSTWWSREAPARGRANVNISVRIPCVPTFCVRAVTWVGGCVRVCACACVSAEIRDEYPPDERDIVEF